MLNAYPHCDHDEPSLDNEYAYVVAEDTFADDEPCLKCEGDSAGCSLCEYTGVNQGGNDAYLHREEN